MEVNLNITREWTDNDILNLKSKFSEMASQLDTLYVTTAPNGAISSRIGAVALYKNGASFELWVNTDGSTAWQRMAAYADLPSTPQAFPVGSVFTSVVSTNPGTLLGYGTWSAFGAGRVLVGIDAGQTEFDTVEETGGAKTVTLTAAQSGVPAHTHPLNGSSGSGKVLKVDAGGVNPASDTSGSNAAANAAEAHTNLQPYIVVYFWKRTA